MSRSRKKTSCHSDYSRSTTKHYKRFASKAVRRYKGTIGKGKNYRKIFPSWDICDYKFKSWDSNDDWYEAGKRK